jgi:hypothetical protein
MTQREVTSSFGGLAARGLYELDKAQIGFDDPTEVDHDRTVLSQHCAKIGMCRLNI